jgi:hypothetical protein
MAPMERFIFSAISRCCIPEASSSRGISSRIAMSDLAQRRDRAFSVPPCLYHFVEQKIVANFD